MSKARIMILSLMLVPTARSFYLPRTKIAPQYFNSPLKLLELAFGGLPAGSRGHVSLTQSGPCGLRSLAAFTTFHHRRCRRHIPRGRTGPAPNIVDRNYLRQSAKSAVLPIETCGFLFDQCRSALSASSAFHSRMQRHHLVRDVVEEVLQRLLHHHLDERVQVGLEDLACLGDPVLFI